MESPIRIAVMCATPGIGLCPYPVELAVCFKQQGHDVHAFCGSDREFETGLHDKLNENNIPIHVVPFSEAIGGRGYSPFDRSLGKALDKIKPDVVQSWGPRFAYQGRPLLFSKHRPLHVAMIMSMGHDLESKTRERIGAMLSNRYLDRVLALCELEAQRLSNVGVRGDKMEIMFAPMACGANLEIAAAARARGREAILREFDLSPQRKYLGYFAHFRPVKRHDLLIQSFIEVMNEFPEWQLVLAGGGQCFDACKALAAPHRDRIHMLGGIQHERAIQLMAMMDAVVHCSTVETFGYSMLEPLLLGVPALLTRVGIAREIEREGKAIVVDPNSGPALKEGLRAIMRADGRLAAMSRESSNWVSKTFDTPLVAANLLNLYRRMLAERSR